MVGGTKKDHPETEIYSGVLNHRSLERTSSRSSRCGRDALTWRVRPGRGDRAPGRMGLLDGNSGAGRALQIVILL